MLFRSYYCKHYTVAKLPYNTQVVAVIFIAVAAAYCSASTSVNAEATDNVSVVIAIVVAPAPSCMKCNAVPIGHATDALAGIVTRFAAALSIVIIELAFANTGA